MINILILTLQYENDMILFLIHLKKSFSRGKGVLWKRLTTEMPQKKKRLIKHSTPVKGGGLKV